MTFFLFYLYISNVYLSNKPIKTGLSFEKKEKEKVNPEDFDGKIQLSHTHTVSSLFGSSVLFYDKAREYLHG